MTIAKHFTSTGQADSEKNELKPHLSQTWCLGKLTSEFIARMERILLLYRLPYSVRRPVLCHDERPCFLIGNLVAGELMKEGQIARTHYCYEKLGSCSLLASIESLTGRRTADVFDHRRKIEFALHFQRIAQIYEEAEKIVVILDNIEYAQ